ncbi:TRAP transporter small permease [Peribacillus sp. Bi134]|uniref:TRAP transporter small permease n=1 Tax=Peribacillus sp. Bi134 TaxID=2884272 RepID=UPI001D433483|nr:TRAP transporter small permease [Peribacillus sp. Bi134]CAH0189825.1 2,3-diketo-L-gulonate TRAP transporter small permease protein YiaM [Peribacillus sp. Bi134]
MKVFMGNLSGKINQISRFFLIFFFIIAFLSTVYQVFSRFILQSMMLKKALPMVDFSIFNLTWIEELIRYLFVWIVFLGIGIVYKSKGHAQVEILHHYLPEIFKNKLLAFIEIVNSFLFLFLIVYGWSILKFTSQQISPSLGINMTFIYGAVLICSLTCLIHSSVHLLGLVSIKNVIKEDVYEEIHKNTNI